MRHALRLVTLFILWTASSHAALAAGAAESALKPETQREDKAAEGILIELSMPRPPNRRPYGPLRAWLQQWQAAETARFKDLAAAHWADAAPGPDHAASSLWIDYTVLTETPQLLSLRLSASE
ncbi:MAG: hypothetical protein IGS03_13640 [Candidatus Sericytochromatia bacterium]|nr:hypothetical protein [Candidatus Sericytochromatia bacterium]